MSRCFPYPPPGYTLSKASKDALIESIKLQKEREKAKAKEQRKKVKKEKKREKKVAKDKAHQNLEKPYTVQGHVGGKLLTDTKGGFPLKRSEAEPEQLSSLTEEHGQAECLGVPSTSSDSTENSNKRKRQSSPKDVTQGPGKIIRIRLSSKKQNESNTSANEHPCSTSGRTEVCSQDKVDTGPMPRREGLCSTSGVGTNIINHGFTQRTTGDQYCSTSQLVSPVAPGRIEVPPVTNLVMTKMQKVELQYKNLIQNWTPPQSQDASLDPEEDLDWLFLRKNKAIHAEERQTSSGKGSSSIPCSSSPTIFPRVQYLQEVDIYALPFTVPF